MNFLKKAFVEFWNKHPGFLQKKISAIYCWVFELGFTRKFIGGYCAFHDLGGDYLSRFSPGSGKEYYTSFQDFFIRRLSSPITSESSCWPCEGVLCEAGKIQSLDSSYVKGRRYSIKDIFGKGGGCIPDSHFFSNIFLSNKDYHRVHSPTTGTIKEIYKIPGRLMLLRPWFYKNFPSVPAFKNERVIVLIEDVKRELWALSIVGGPGVGTISLTPEAVVGGVVRSGCELAVFKLGSTCCLASPYSPKEYATGQNVIVGTDF